MDNPRGGEVRRRRKEKSVASNKNAEETKKTKSSKKHLPEEQTEDTDDTKHVYSFISFINIAVGITALIIIAVKYVHYCGALLEKDLWFSNIKEVEREISFRTESGLYYSYYKQLVYSRSLGEGLHELQNDNLTEYPDTINVLERMNVYQEIFLAALYKNVALLQEWYEPIYFYIRSIFSLQGLQIGCIFTLTWQLSGTWVSGVLTSAFFILNKADTTRAAYVIALRENFSLPFLWLQFVFITSFLRSSNSLVKEVLCVLGILFSTFMFALMWQFNQFILLLQAAALFGLQVLHLAPHNKLCSLYLIIGASMISVWAMQFFNPMIPTGFLCSFIPAALIIMYLQTNCYHPSRATTLPKNIVRIFLLVILVFILTGMINSAVKFLIKQESDEHILHFVLTKLGITQTRSLDVQLYLCTGAFSFLTYDVYERLFQSYLLPLYAVVHLCLLVYIVLYTISLSSRTTSTETDVTHCKVPCELAFHIIQAVLFGLLAITTLRMKYLWTPYMCILASYGVSLTPLSLLKAQWSTSLKVKVLGHALMLLTLGNLLYKMLPAAFAEMEDLREFYDPDTVELMEWIKSSTPRGAAYCGSMQLMAGIKLCTKRPITNHPHFENKHLRLKTAEVYKIYGKSSVAEVHSILTKYDASYMVLEDSICLAGSPDGCSLPDLVDVHYGYKPDNGPYGTNFTRSSHPRFCEVIRHGYPEHSNFFKLVFSNRTFRVYRVLPV